MSALARHVAVSSLPPPTSNRDEPAKPSSEDEVEQMAAAMSHELYGPLRTAHSFLSILEEEHGGELSEEAMMFLHHALDTTARAGRIARGLVAWSRIHHHGRPPVRCSFDRLLDEALDQLELDVRVDRQPLPTLMVDRAQMITVLRELLSNVVRFSREDPATVEIWSDRSEDGWRFALKDQGIGLDMRHAQRIFELFQRLHSQRAYPGEGVGLALCKRIVERHGGRIWVEAVPSEGATFYFWLPG